MLRVSGADVDILGRGYQPFEEKADGLAPYRFSIITENVRNHSYFTEKIVDALLCETVPIYWGAPNIDRFFDPRGMIACKNAAEMFDAAGRADEKLYQEMKPALLHAKEQAIAHSNYKPRRRIDYSKRIVIVDIEDRKKAASLLTQPLFLTRDQTHAL